MSNRPVKMINYNIIIFCTVMARKKGSIIILHIYKKSFFSGKEYHNIYLYLILSSMSNHILA